MSDIEKYLEVIRWAKSYLPDAEAQELFERAYQAIENKIDGFRGATPSLCQCSECRDIDCW